MGSMDDTVWDHNTKETDHNKIVRKGKAKISKAHFHHKFY